MSANILACIYIAYQMICILSDYLARYGIDLFYLNSNVDALTHLHSFLL